MKENELGSIIECFLYRTFLKVSLLPRINSTYVYFYLMERQKQTDIDTKHNIGALLNDCWGFNAI